MGLQFTRSALSSLEECARVRGNSAGSSEGGASWVILNGAEIDNPEDPMNKALFRITMTGMLALALLAASQPARAQERLIADIPFAFTAGAMTLPAGEYRVERLTEDPATLLIQRTDGSAAMAVITFAASANNPQAQSKLVFHRYGDRCFLSQIWVAGNTRGRQLQKSPQEKEEQGLLAHNGKPEQATIVASLHPPKP